MLSHGIWNCILVKYFYHCVILYILTRYLCLWEQLQRIRWPLLSVHEYCIHLGSRTKILPGSGWKFSRNTELRRTSIRGRYVMLWTKLSGLAFFWVGVILFENVPKNGNWKKWFGKGCPPKIIKKIICQNLRIVHIHDVEITKIRPPGKFCLIILQPEMDVSHGAHKSMPP